MSEEKPDKTMKTTPTRPLAGGQLEELFKAYFNNRMMVLLMMIEHPEISRQALSIDRQKFFLKDLYHHFLPPSCPSKYRWAMEWLFRFLDVYPDISPQRVYQAIRMVRLVYEALGMELPPRLEAARLEKEFMAGRQKREE